MPCSLPGRLQGGCWKSRWWEGLDAWGQGGAEGRPGTAAAPLLESWPVRSWPHQGFTWTLALCVL